MKKNRLIALILVMLMLFQTLPVLGAESGDVTVFPTDDSYIVSGSRLEHKNYGNAGVFPSRRTEYPRDGVFERLSAPLRLVS